MKYKREQMHFVRMLEIKKTKIWVAYPIRRETKGLLISTLVAKQTIPLANHKQINIKNVTKVYTDKLKHYGTLMEILPAALLLSRRWK